MKVLFDHPHPFLLAHGGFQRQIEQTRLALEGMGVEVEFLRWWDDAQRSDIIHFFGRPSHAYLEFAGQKGIVVVVGDLLTGLGSRGTRARTAQRLVIAVLRRTSFFDRMGWEAYRRADAVVALTAWEAQLVREIFGAPAERVHVVPNGVEKAFFSAPVRERGPWLVCTATITLRKRVQELAEAAVNAGTPLWVVGEPYAERDPYFEKFRALTSAHPAILRYEGGVSDRAALAQIYSEARGFVLLSTMESLSLSALEAAACRCPLLLSDLPWARTTFDKAAHYCSVTSDLRETARHLRAFYDAAPALRPPPLPATWSEVARQLVAIYELARSTSR